MPALLRRSKDRKVCNSTTAGGAVRIGNSFGLPSGLPSNGGSCPSMTEACGSCYAGRLEKVYVGVRTALDTNLALLLACEDDRTKMTSLLVKMVREFRDECIKWDAERIFRIHWDGDFFSDNYTRAWVTTIRGMPSVKFWVYTRNESAYRILMDANLPNLTTWFSVDATTRHVDGVSQHTIADKLAGEYGDRFRPAYMADTFADAQAGNKALTSKPGAKCPEITGQIGMVGACQTCRLCIDKPARAIAFSVSKR